MRRTILLAGLLVASGCYHVRGGEEPDAVVTHDADPQPDVEQTPDAPEPPDAGVDAPEPVDATHDGGPVGLGTGVSFRVAIALAFTSAAPASMPDTLAATVWLAPNADGTIDAVTQAIAFGQRLTITPTPDGALELGWRWYPIEPLGACAAIVNARLTARVFLFDDDGDGVADRMTGAGEGRLQHVVTDFTEDFLDYTATLEGHAEHEPPTARWVQRVEGHVALFTDEGPTLVASEPLILSGTAWLEGADGERVALEPIPIDLGTVIAGWRLPRHELLPFAASLELRTDNPLRDLNGLELAEPLPLATAGIPIALANADFESDASAQLEGDARIVTALGSLAPISGARSALVASDWTGRGGSVVTTRVTVRPGATHVRFRARYLSRSVLPPESSWGAPPMLHVRVVPQTGDYSYVWGGAPATERIATGDAVWQTASEIVDVEVPLPPSASGEVAVLVGDDYGCLGMVPLLPAVSVLIDDVRTE